MAKIAKFKQLPIISAKKCCEKNKKYNGHK